MKATEVAAEQFRRNVLFYAKETAMNTVKVKAYAKLNLTLEITGEKAGYHLLDSLVCNVDLFDYIVLKKRKDALSFVRMHGMGSESIPPEKNNALKAAEAFSARFQTTGADIMVYKNIPMGAGLGGSSADISGVINGMAKLYGVTDERALEALADELGSDTRYMLKGGFARMQGRGEQVTPLGKTPLLHFLLLCPNDGVSSGACYKKYDELALKSDKKAESVTEKCIAALQNGDVNEGGRYLMNDLFPAASALCGAVEKAMEEALSFSPLGAVMTGSGSCVAALFETKELCEWAKSRYRGKFYATVVKTVDTIQENKGWRNPFALQEE